MARLLTIGCCVALATVLVVLPLLLRSPSSDRDSAGLVWLQALEPRGLGRSYPPSDREYERTGIGQPEDGLPLVANVQIVDYDADGRPELIVCDLRRQAIIAYAWREGRWLETILATDVSAPARCTFADVDGDGDLDLLVADLGDLFPNDERVGRVLLYRNDGGVYTRMVLLDHLRRVADVQAADLDGDGDLDLVVAEFGHLRGSVFWLEQTGPLAFTRHDLLAGSGAIHVPLADYDGDGDIDIAAVLSQDEEEVWILANDGAGRFTPHLIFHDPNFELGSGGLVACDIDQDGDIDLLLPAGDNLERAVRHPQAYHGCYLLENRGDLTFVTQRIADLPGTYAVAPGDLDGDGDLDLVLVSMGNDWSDPAAASIVALIHDGALGFTPQQIDTAPIQMITCVVGDLDQDGHNEIVAGSLRIHPPYTAIERLSWWRWRKP